MNRARAVRPDVVRGDLDTAWIYVAGALVGIAFKWIQQVEPAASGAIAAQGGFDGGDPPEVAV